MIHLSKFLIGFRHKRIFRAKSMTGYVIDGILKEYPEKFTGVAETHDREELVLTDSKGIYSFRNNKDDIILENMKIFDIETRKYVEVDRKDLIGIAEKCLPVVSETLGLKDDFKRIGMIFEFKLPKWDEMGDRSFAQIIHENFVKCTTPSLIEAEIAESSIRFAYKLKAPGGAVIKKLKDYRNVIIRIEESAGLDESGIVQKGLLVSVDIQHYYDPRKFTKDIDILGHHDFAWEHFKSIIIPEFEDKGIKINYE